MLTILTGAPGAGKTCAMVSLLSELGKDRALFVDGVNGLTIDHTPIDARQWHNTVPDGGAIAVDEGQRLWRPRGPGSKVPDDIAAMETHRHRGLDIFVTTQAPNLLDANIRNLCGRHVHIRDLGILGRWWYEWPECSDNPKQSWRTAPLKKRYKLDKKAFAKYKSASMHIKPIRSLPWMLVVLIVALLLVAGLGFRTYQIIRDKMAPPAATVPAAQPVPAGAVAPMQTTFRAGSGNLQPAYLTDVTQFTPRLSSKPETAPAYDDLRRVAVVPRVVGGYCQDERCYCINQQGTSAGLSNAECRDWLKAPPFDPYRLPVLPQSSGSPQAEATAPKAPPS